MKSIVHTVYQRGSASLSNLIMSVELGVVLASLTNRVLILKDNKTPKANIVRYDNLVRNTYPSRVTDLIDLGVPWIDADQINLAAFAPMEICDKPAWDCVCYLPAHLSTDSKDFRHFAADQTHFFTVGEELQHVPALSVSGGAEADTLSFYSTFFYLDRAAQLEMHDALWRMKPKPELAAFARDDRVRSRCIQRRPHSPRRLQEDQRRDHAGPQKRGSHQGDGPPFQPQ